ncbi:Aspartate aminotransferase [Granulosicoccus antarcticus IMCC3135]|uniref:Aminotransferase n=2 Tax=Granulosicoccus TaxID=437504 RepID=A0A2Z2NTL7_9GAMM|nr:Aspartate aminotransferase [Granulosicoccus antarcticus IMCC3135]
MPSSARAARLKPSQIREVAELGMTLPDVTPLWFGESAWPTGEIAVQAAISALSGGDHFYQPNSGKISFRNAICQYLESWYEQPFERSRITVTASGMQGLALTAQALIDPGDQVVCIEPAWPNMAECFQIAGADIRTLALDIVDDQWTLDLDHLISLITPSTKALVINSPSNPTGWVMPAADQASLLEHCRKTGTWIVADDVYARLYRHGPVAPGFLALATPDDRLISVSSFSKAWSMTGWRLGWITAPAELEATFAMLTEFNIAGPSGIIQQAGERMIIDGESEVELLTQRLQAGYAQVEACLEAIPTVRFVRPEGAFYCFFAVDGMSDSVSFAKTLLHDAKVGLAPGRAFGPAGEGYLRLCYAQPSSTLEPALERLRRALTR